MIFDINYVCSEGSSVYVVIVIASNPGPEIRPGTYFVRMCENTRQKLANTCWLIVEQR